MMRSRQIKFLKATAVIAGILMLGGVVLTWIGVAHPDGDALGGAGIAITITFVIIAVLSTSVIERWRRQATKS